MRIISHHFTQSTCDTEGSQTQPYMIVKKTRGFLFVSWTNKSKKEQIKQLSARTEQNGSPPKPVLRQGNARSKSSSSHEKRYNQRAQKKKQTATQARTHTTSSNLRGTKKTP
jgi:monomeric isocitrate dehydrogenase